MAKSYATILRKLCQDYAAHKISFDDYRSKRRLLLQKIDEQFNGGTASTDQDSELTMPGLPQGEFGLTQHVHDPVDSDS